MAKDVFTSVRKSLVENLKSSEALPHEVALTLAQDIEEISIPMIELSSVLTDDDLIDIIKSRKAETINKAVTKRKRLSSKLSNTIIEESNNSETITKLLNNEGAEVLLEGYDKIAEKFAGNSEIILAVSERSNVPKEIVGKFISKASDILRNKLKILYPDRFEQYKPSMDSSISRSWEISTLSAISPDSSEKEVFDLVFQLQSSNKLTPTIVLVSLCIGYVTFFQMSLAALVKGRFKNIVKSLNENLNENLPVLYSKARLPESLKDAIVCIYKVVVEINQSKEVTPGPNLKYINLLLEKIMYITQNQEIQGMDFILNMIKRNKAYKK